MAINLVTKFQPYTDEQFSTESKKALITNQDLAWTGAHTIKVYKVTTSQMNDYGRNGPAQGNWSRYGAVSALDATTEEFTLKKDRSFTFAIDKLDRTVRWSSRRWMPTSTASCAKRPATSPRPRP